MTLPSDLAPIRGLLEYLKTEMPSVQKFYDQWPYHGDELVYPCISLMYVGTPSFRNLPPYIFKTEEDPENALNDLVYEVIGNHEGTIQLDIWAEYKISRSRILELVNTALNKQQINSDLPAGLSLTLSEYHNAIARFDKVGYTYMDSEENSNKAYWRVKLDLLFQSPEIMVRSLPRMSEITLKSEVKEDVLVNEFETDIIGE